MSLSVLQAGPMLSVQDLGRKGLLHAGVSGSGPMDPPSFRIANALVGNPETSAALEFALVGGVFAVTHPVRVAVTGADIDIRIDGVSRPAWESHDLRPGSKLAVGGVRGAVWGYLAISGGIDTPVVLGSRATHLRTALGGHQGRRLQAGDTLGLGGGASGPLLRLATMWRQAAHPIRVVAGPQDDYFGPDAWAVFTGARFVVSAARDRMAQMLEGPMITAVRGHDIVSDGTVAGSIQVPASGKPLVLMAERQTTGGYPKIGTVASADLPRLAQTPSGQAVRFKVITQEQAEALLLGWRRAWRTVIANLAEKPRAAARTRSG
ncbi:MAG: biotin-dependent carboxyltransferase family protein [Azospirillaceae bacterium]|nr:biotin-dependent carboxyltransferase family protein [Azospirillaceae bacterium]